MIAGFATTADTCTATDQNYSDQGFHKIYEACSFPDYLEDIPILINHLTAYISKFKLNIFLLKLESRCRSPTNCFKRLFIPLYISRMVTKDLKLVSY